MCLQVIRPVRRQFLSSKKKYPNANMSKFDFEVDVDLSGKVTGVVVNYKVDEDTSYDITSYGFKSNPEWVKFLFSFVPTRDGWPTIWASGGSIPAFSNLREPKHDGVFTTILFSRRLLIYGIRCIISRYMFPIRITSILNLIR